MNYNAFTRALAYERIKGSAPDIPDPRLGIGAAEEHGSIARQQLNRSAPGAAKVAGVKTADDMQYIDDGKTFTQKDFEQSGYIGEVL